MQPRLGGERRLLGRRRGIGPVVRVGQRQRCGAPPALPVVVGDHVVGDGEEPGPELGDVRAGDRRQGLGEDLLGGVGRGVRVAEAAQAVVVDRIEVGAVEGGEGGGIAPRGGDRQRDGVAVVPPDACRGGAPWPRSAHTFPPSRDERDFHAVEVDAAGAKRIQGAGGGGWRSTDRRRGSTAQSHLLAST